MIPSLEAIKVINARRRDALVVSATSSLREWSSVSGRRDLDVDLSDCMDKASSVALGIALARPDRKVMVLDCDSVLRANLGSLITVGRAAPRNVVHFLFEDASHLSTDGQPIPGMDHIDFVGLARGGGYPRAYSFDSFEDLVIGIDEVLEGDGPTFVFLRVVHDVDLPDYPGRSLGKSLRDVKAALGRARHEDERRGD